MVGLEDLTVGQVSGMIAAAVFLVQVFVPIALPVILLGLLRVRNSAVTETAVSWSVIGRFLHSSLWPVILGTDSAATLSANRSTLIMSWFRIFMLVLVAVAAIVTPLGLYEGLVGQTGSTSQGFHFIEDPSTFGLGTPLRTSASGTWSRICGYSLPYACPNSGNNLTTIRNATGGYVQSDYYSSKIPQDVIEIFESGLVEQEPSVSGPFDIQYRSYVQSLIDNDGRGIPIDNGTTPYTKGAYQSLSTMILSNSYLAIEGLVVDMIDGGIGFRKHSAPSPHTYGSSWSEDILFATPETVCVDTNLTLDFFIPGTREEEIVAGIGELFKLNLTDRGGFVNLNQTYPFWERGDTQANPELRLRAYKAAWLNNALSMAFMNVTNIANETNHLTAFSYLNSTMNQTFPLHYPDGETASAYTTIEPGRLQMSKSFGAYLEGLDRAPSNNYTFSGVSNSSKTAQPSLYANPFDISVVLGRDHYYSNFSDAELVCAGAGGGDLANITNMVASCGLLYGAPRRQDGSASLLFDPGSSWTLPMYSCMSTVKASIKTVSFEFNESDNLSGLTVRSVKDKEYVDEASKPLWAVEDSDMPLKEGNPLWGIVTPETARQLNLSTVRKDHLYLPGYSGPVRGLLASHQNLPGADFAVKALSGAYAVQNTMTSGQLDYSGHNNLALYRLWQEYSRSSATSAKILNLIWTDIAANMVMGTKGLPVLPEPATMRKRGEPSSAASKMPLVTTYTRRIKYRYAYGIPAFLALSLTTLATLAMTYFTIFGHTKPSTMRTFLQHTSAGRLLSAQSNTARPTANTRLNGCTTLDREFTVSSETTEDWIRGGGKDEFTLSTEGWSEIVQPHGPGYDKAGTTASYAPVPNTHAY